jgi:hypothetical protein
MKKWACSLDLILLADLLHLLLLFPHQSILLLLDFWTRYVNLLQNVCNYLLCNIIMHIDERSNVFYYDKLFKWNTHYIIMEF